MNYSPLKKKLQIFLQGLLLSASFKLLPPLHLQVTFEGIKMRREDSDRDREREREREREGGGGGGRDTHNLFTINRKTCICSITLGLVYNHSSCLFHTPLACI